MTWSYIDETVKDAPKNKHMDLEQLRASKAGY
jgi:hypothetical protein